MDIYAGETGQMEKRQVIGIGRTAEILAWNGNTVVKLFRENWPLTLAKWEEKVARLVSEAGAPMPAVHGIVEFEGRHGIIYERVDGPSMLEELMSKTEETEHFANVFAELHAQIHSLKVRGLESQRSQLEKKIRNAKPLPENGKGRALEALRKLPDDNVLCHGDFHPDNIIMSTHGPIVIDWNDATQGNRLGDISRTLLLLQHGEPVQPFRQDKEQIQSLRTRFIMIYLRRYSQIRPMSLENVQMWHLPITAARLSESIKEEESRLLSIVESLLTDQ